MKSNNHALCQLSFNWLLDKIRSVIESMRSKKRFSATDEQQRTIQYLIIFLMKMIGLVQQLFDSFCKLFNQYLSRLHSILFNCFPHIIFKWFIIVVLMPKITIDSIDVYMLELSFWSMSVETTLLCT